MNNPVQQNVYFRDPAAIPIVLLATTGTLIMHLPKGAIIMVPGYPVKPYTYTKQGSSINGVPQAHNNVQDDPHG